MTEVDSDTPLQDNRSLYINFATREYAFDNSRIAKRYQTVPTGPKISLLGYALKIRCIQLHKLLIARHTATQPILSQITSGVVYTDASIITAAVTRLPVHQYTSRETGKKYIPERKRMSRSIITPKLDTFWPAQKGDVDAVVKIIDEETHWNRGVRAS